MSYKISGVYVSCTRLLLLTFIWIRSLGLRVPPVNAIAAVIDRVLPGVEQASECGIAFWMQRELELEEGLAEEVAWLPVPDCYLASVPVVLQHPAPWVVGPVLAPVQATAVRHLAAWVPDLIPEPAASMQDAPAPAQPTSWHRIPAPAHRQRLWLPGKSVGWGAAAGGREAE